MAKNLIPQVSQMLGVELDEKFKITGYRGIFYFADDCLMHQNAETYANEETNYIIPELLNGSCELTKLPWKPKINEMYFSFKITGGELTVDHFFWEELFTNYILLNKGWIFRTREEAENALPSVAKEMNIKYVI